MKHYTIINCEEEPDYRYLLEVYTGAGTKTMKVIQCNPSHASKRISDPTVGKVSIWGKENGYGTIHFLNLFARRSSKVASITGLPYDILVGEKNDVTLQQQCTPDHPVICAWGSSLPVPPELYSARLRQLRLLLKDTQLYRMGDLVQGRYPRHGRMWNSGQRAMNRLHWHELGI